MSETSIRQALDAIVDTWAAGLTPAIARAWEAVTYRPTIGVPYISSQVSALDQTPLGPGTKTVVQWDGIYQVAYHRSPDKGTDYLTTWSDQIKALFPRGLTLITTDNWQVNIELARKGPIIEDADWAQSPVLVKFQAFEFT